MGLYTHDYQVTVSPPLSSPLLLSLLALLPPLAILLLLVFRPRWGRPHSPSFRSARGTWILTSLGLGVAAAGGAAVIEQGLTHLPWSMANLGGLALFTLVVAGVTEELAKYAALRVSVWRFARHAEPYDDLVYGAAVGLGFGAIENVLYVLHGGSKVALVRAFTAVPFHALLGMLLGVFVGRARQARREGRRWGSHHVTGVTAAALLHGFYDLWAFLGSMAAYVALAVIVLLLAVWCIRSAVVAWRASPTWSGKPVPAPKSVVRRRPLSPEAAALLGLFPGMGHIGNEYYGPGIFFALVTVVHVITLGLVWLWIIAPRLVVALLQQIGGVTLAIPVDALESIIDWRGALALTLLSFLLPLVSAYDAYRCAKEEGNPVRHAARFLPTAAWGSYLVHLLAVYAFLFVPILTGGGSGGKSAKGNEQEKGAKHGSKGSDEQEGSGQRSQPGDLDGAVFEVDLTVAPDTVDGFHRSREGSATGPDAQTQRTKGARLPVAGHDEVARPAQAPAGANGEGDALPGTLSEKTNPPAGNQGESEQDQQAKGKSHSYNEYISYLLHRDSNYRVYFKSKQRLDYAVVEYTILTDGTIVDVRVLPEHSKGEPAISELAAEEVRSLSPAAPLPKGVRLLHVTELFWNTNTFLPPPGSLEQELSKLPDGRRITSEESEP